MIENRMRYIRSVLELHMLTHVCIQLCINALLLLLTSIKKPFAVVHAPESTARQLDRDMRNEVRTTGKRPRDACTDMIASVPKKFKTSDTQESVIVQLPAYQDRENTTVRDSVRQLMAMTALQAFAVPLVWDWWLRFRSQSNSPATLRRAHPHHTN